MEKKYIKTFETFKNSKNVEPVNEELLGLGRLYNFFKNIFKKAQEKIKALTSFDDVKKYYQEKFLAPKSSEPEGIFSAVLKEYEAKAQFNDQDCFDLVAKIIDPDNADCVLNSKNIQAAIDGYDEKTKKEQQYMMETVRNKTLVALKYGGTTATSFVVGKALPVPAIPLDRKLTQRIEGNKFDTKKEHLPKLKEKIVNVADGAAKKKAGLDFVRDILIPQMIGFCNLITEEEIDKFSGADVKEVGVLGSYGVKEEKELVGKDIYYMMDGYDAKAPKKELVGKGKVIAFDEKKGFSIETEKGSKFDKNADKLLSKVEAEKLLGVKEGDVMDYTRVKKLYDDKTEVYYLLPGVDKTSYDLKKKPEEQPDIADKGLIISVDDQNTDKSIKFEKDGKTIERSYDDIVGFVGDQEKSEEAQEVAKKLGEIKDDPKKMKYVGDYTDFINKATEDDVNTMNDMIKDELDKLPK
jgi:hypothetical protein